MTYFGFLLRFLVIPIGLLLGLHLWDRKQERALPPELRRPRPWLVIPVHMLVALIYTTPWDNYLVATRVWWYEPELVMGLTIGWVPIEEYTFFVLQPLLGGLLLLFLARRIPVPAESPERYRSLRWWSTGLLGLFWVTSVVLLLSGWGPGTYLSIQLAWALPPIMLQTFFGADILWRHRRLVLTNIAITTLYLAVTDGLAIDGGTWTINPELSLHILLGGILPLEEFTFFLVTNVLITFGSTLMLAEESYERMPGALRRVLFPSGQGAEGV